MKFEDLGEFDQELLTDAFQAQLTQRMRAIIGVPILLGIGGGAFWFFIWSDTSGQGGTFGIPVMLVTGVLALLMTLETVGSKNVKWALDSLNLSDEDRRSVLESMKSSPRLRASRKVALATIGHELKEGAKRASHYR